MNAEKSIARLRYWCGTQPEYLLSNEEFQEVVRMVVKNKGAGGAA